MTPEGSLDLESRIGLLRTLLRDCESVYGAGSDDIPSAENVVRRYLDREGQLKYVHMYFAKFVACWRHLRRALQIPSEGPVWSVGAGPCSCLFGWFFDSPGTVGQRVVGVDPLDWQFVRDLPSHTALHTEFLGAATFEFMPRRFFPASRAPQLSGIEDLGFLDPEEITLGSTVLIPFVLNHLVGRVTPMPTAASLWSWLQAVRMRASRVIVADMQCDPAKHTDGFWRAVNAGLRIVGDPTVRTFGSDLEPFASAFSQRNGWPRRRTSHFMSQATVLIGEKQGWRYF